MKIGTVLAAVGLVIAGAWYNIRQIHQKTVQVSSAACNGQVIILDAGHGESY